MKFNILKYFSINKCMWLSEICKMDTILSFKYNMSGKYSTQYKTLKKWYQNYLGYRPFKYAECRFCFNIFYVIHWKQKDIKFSSV